MARHIELYYMPASYYSQKIRMYLSEKGVTPKLHVVNLRKGQNLSPEFLRLNPAGQVPVLKTMDSTVPDSHEIYKYGEENIPGNTLVPSDIANQVWGLHDTISAINMYVLTFGCLVQPKFSEGVDMKPAWKKNMQNIDGMKKRIENKMVGAPADQVPFLSKKVEEMGEKIRKAKDEAEVEAVIKQTGEVLAQCERQLEKSGGPFLFGGTVTVADIDLIVLVMRVRMMGLEERLMSDEQRPKLHSFLFAMEKRKSYQMILKESKTFGEPPFSIGPLIGGAFAVLGIAVGIGLFLYFKKRN